MEDAYVINLKTSEDRWLNIQKEFEGTSIQLHRIEPVKLPPKKATVTRRNYGARSLVLTFLNLIQMAKRKNLPEILILEDDCFPVKDFEPRWQKIKTWLRENPEEWDLYSGGSIWLEDPFLVGYTEDLSFYRPKTAACSQWIWAQKKSYDRIIQKYKSVLKLNRGVATDHINYKLKLIVSYPFISYQSAKKSTLSGKTPDAVIDRFKEEEHALKNYRHSKLFHPTLNPYKRYTRRKNSKGSL